MKAAVLRAPGKIEIEDIDLPVPGPGEVRVRVLASGVCRSDLSAFDGHVPIPLPAVLGHEGAGVVDAVGDNVRDLAPGDHVVMTITPGCATCFQCQRGAFGLCEVGAPHFLDGGLIHGQRRLSHGPETINHYLMQSSFAEYAVVERWNAVKIRDDVPFEIACLAACGLSTGFGAVVNRAQLAIGETLLVIGVGGVGLAAVLGAASVGASRIIVADSNPAACELARVLGATDVIDVASGADVAAECKRLTGRGVDASVDAVGTPATVLSAFTALRAGGRAVVLGVADATAMVQVPLYSFIEQRTLTGSTNGSIKPHVDIPLILDLYMAGRLPLDKLVTGRHTLDEVSDVLGDLGRRPGRAVITM